MVRLSIATAITVALLIVSVAGAQTGTQTTPADKTKTMAPSTSSVYETIRADTGLSRFSTTQGLSTSLSGKGPYTVFAPANTLYGTTTPNYYIVSRNLTMTDLRNMNGQMLTTTTGEQLKVEVKDNNVWVGGVQLSGTGMTASNGMIYSINRPMTAAKTNPPKSTAPPSTGGGTR